VLAEGTAVVTAIEPPQQPKKSEAYRVWEVQRMNVELQLESLRRQHAIAEGQLDEANQRLAKFESLYNRLVEQDEEMRHLIDQRNEANKELSVWQSHRRQLERILTAESGERGTQFTIIEDPENVARPTKPRVASVFVVCSGLGLAAAALLVALAELFDRSFRSVGQVTRVLGVPVLECIGVIPTPKEKRKLAVSRLVWTPTVGLLVCALVASAAMAYASIEMPGVHKRAMNRVDNLLGTNITTLSAVAERPG
jgi:hypothetical protein